MGKLKVCNRCGEAKEAFWKNQRSPDGQDTVCVDCRVAEKLKHEATPLGLYGLKARLLATICRHRWFGNYDIGNYQIDHKFSIRKGYQRNIPLSIIANRENLQLLTIAENRRKGSACSIGIGQLTREANTREIERMACLLDSVDDSAKLRRWAELAHRKNVEFQQSHAI